MEKAVSAGGIVVQGNKIIFIVYPSGQISFPKGTPEVGETMEQTAIREVAEETGLKNPKIVKKLGILTRRGETRPRKPVMKDITLYHMVVDSFVQENPDEVTEWLTIEEARLRMFAEELKFLEGIRSDIGL